MITQAYAASHPGGGDVFLQLLPFLLIFLIIYFLILRPQQKRVKAHKEMIDSLKKGDTVITQGGLIGKISKIIPSKQIKSMLIDLNFEKYSIYIPIRESFLDV